MTRKKRGNKVAIYTRFPLSYDNNDYSRSVVAIQYDKPIIIY